jgi:hypothetical protein
MPSIEVALGGISALGSIGGSRSSSRAASGASATQAASAQAGIDEQRRQFESIQQNLSPFINAGNSALAGQLALLGMGGGAQSREPSWVAEAANGPSGARRTLARGMQGLRSASEVGAQDRAFTAQETAFAQIENSPGFQASIQQGENAILQNASATGGLRGGNTQAALAQFRPAMLQQAIDAQYQRLGGLAASGQNSAAMVGQAGQASAGNISNLLNQQGAAVAGGQIAGAQAFGQGLQGVSQAVGYGLSSPAAQTALFGASPQFPATPNFAGLY